MSERRAPTGIGMDQRYARADGTIDVERLRRETSIAAVARGATDLKRCGAELRGLCPIHDEDTPSFHVNDAKGLYHCFGCGAGGDAIDLFGRLNDTGFVESCAALAGRGHSPSAGADPEKVAVERVLARRRAFEEWRRAKPIEGTPAETYLLSRGVGTGVPGSIRFSMVPRFWHDDGREGVRHPAMVAAVQDVDGRVVGIHRTFVDREGRKARRGEPRLALGRVRSCAIRLGPIAPQIMVATGIEDGLALRLMFPGATVWVTPGDANLPHLRPPRGVRRVVLCGDDDASGRAAVAAARTALAAMGVETDELFPRAGVKDFNEEWLVVHV